MCQFLLSVGFATGISLFFFLSYVPIISSLNSSVNPIIYNNILTSNDPIVEFVEVNDPLTIFGRIYKNNLTHNGTTKTTVKGIVLKDATNTMNIDVWCNIFEDIPYDITVTGTIIDQASGGKNSGNTHSRGVFVIDNFFADQLVVYEYDMGRNNNLAIINATAGNLVNVHNNTSANTCPDITCHGFPAGIANSMGRVAEKLIVYPNPANDYIKFEINTGQSNSFKQYIIITDITGKELMVLTLNKNDNGIELQTALLASGMYIAKLIQDDISVKSLKFVVKH